jgi:UrcA family protein
MRNGRHFTTLVPACVTMAGALLLAGPGNAFAATTDGAPSVTIRFADLNLNTTAGARTLYQRISGAAHLVCGPDGRGFDEQREWRGCYQQAVRNAVAQVHSPLLSSEFAEQQGELRTAMLSE